MKKTVSLLLALLLMLGTLSLGAFALDDISVYVSIADENGKLVLSNEKVTVWDADSDKKLTINDALFCAHEEFYHGKAAEGYRCERTQYGLSLMKLWGYDGGTGYGYYLNNASPLSLEDKIKEDDSVYAFVYTDTVGFSDQFCFFEQTQLSMRSYTFSEIKVYKYEYDENWNTVQKPVEGARLTIDGKETKYVADKDGNIRFPILRSGEYVLSIVAPDGEVLTPPVCRVSVSKGSLVDFFSYLMAWVMAKLHIGEKKAAK